MARSPRCEYFTPDQQAFVLAICHSSRTALAQDHDISDSATNTHRVQFVEELIRVFAHLFCVSVHSQSVLPHQIRLVLEAHPEQAQKLDDTEVAFRWLSLCPSLRPPKLRSCEPTREEILKMCADPNRIAQIRRQLSDISWFMRLLQQRTALFCNQEDDFQGHFWSDRYRSILLLGKQFRLLGLLHVDLGAICRDPDKPFSRQEFASAILRLLELLETEKHQASSNAPEDDSTSPCSTSTTCSGQDLPATVSPTGQDAATSQAMIDFNNSSKSAAATQRDCHEYTGVTLQLAEYPELLKAIQSEISGQPVDSIPNCLSLIMSEVRLTREALAAFVCNFDLLFSHVAGSPMKMAAFVTNVSRRRAWVTPEAREFFRRSGLASTAACLS